MSLISQTDNSSAINSYFKMASINPLTSDIYLDDFNIVDIDSNPISIVSAVSNNDAKLIVLNVYATWCPYCKKEMNALNLLNESVEDLKVIGLDSGEKAPYVKAFMQKNFNLDFPIFVDNDNLFAITYGVSGLPTTVFLNQEHKILAVKIGYMDWSKTIPIFKKIVELL